MRIKEEDYKEAVFSVSSKIYNGKIPPTKDFNILVHATKKQIGERVAISEKYGSFRCPRCNIIVRRSQHYCSQCGQKLDWRN